MNLQIINDCAGTDPGLQIAGTDPDRRYKCVQTKHLGRYFVISRR